LSFGTVSGCHTLCLGCSATMRREADALRQGSCSPQLRSLVEGWRRKRKAPRPRARSSFAAGARPGLPPAPLVCEEDASLTSSL
jgi:hypothetical protein